MPDPMPDLMPISGWRARVPRRPGLRGLPSAGLGRRRAVAALWRAAEAESPALRLAGMPAATTWRQASLPDVEGGIFAARKWCELGWIVAKFQRALVCVAFFSPGWEARLYGRQGCPPPR